MIYRRSQEKRRLAAFLKPGMEVKRKCGEWVYIINVEREASNVVLRLVDGSEHVLSKKDEVMSR